MSTTTVSTEQFRAEAERRLIDTFDLMTKLGLRTRAAIWKRVETGQLPPPVINRPSSYALWDLDAVETTTTTRQKG